MINYHRNIQILYNIHVMQNFFKSLGTWNAPAKETSQNFSIPINISKIT